MGWSEDRIAAAGLLRLVRKERSVDSMTPWDVCVSAARVAHSENQHGVFTVLRETATHFAPPTTINIDQRYPWR